MMAEKYRDAIARMMDREWKYLSLESKKLNCSYDDYGYEVIEIEGKWLRPDNAMFMDKDKEWSRRRLVKYIHGYNVLKDMVCRLGLYWERSETGKHYVGNS